MNWIANLWNLEDKCRIQKGSPIIPILVGLGSLRVTCSPRDPRFAGSNSTEVDGFLGRKNFEAQVLRKGLIFKLGDTILKFQVFLKNLMPIKIGPWAKFNRHIDVLAIPIRGSTIDLKRSQCIGQQWPTLQYNTIQYNTIPILSRINQIPCIDTYFFKIHSDIVLPSTLRPS